MNEEFCKINTRGQYYKTFMVVTYRNKLESLKLSVTYILVKYLRSRLPFKWSQNKGSTLLFRALRRLGYSGKQASLLQKGNIKVKIYSPSQAWARLIFGLFMSRSLEQGEIF
jgi:hypothetical protein